MFRKLFVFLFIMSVVVSVSFAGEEVVEHEGTITIQDSSQPDIFVNRSHVCDSGSLDCAIPENIIAGTPELYVRVYLPSTQVYDRHYIVTDVQGAFIYYEFISSSVTSGFNVFSLVVPLANGQYQFYFIAAGADGKAGMSDRYSFKVF